MKTYLLHPFTAFVLGGFLIGLGVDMKMLSIALPGVACVVYGIGRGFVWLLHNVE